MTGPTSQFCSHLSLEKYNVHDLKGSRLLCDYLILFSSIPCPTSLFHPLGVLIFLPVLLCSPLLLLLVVFIFYLSYSAPLYFSFQQCLYSTCLSLLPSTSPSSSVYILPALLCSPLLLLLVVFIFYLPFSAPLYFYFQSCLYSTCLTLPPLLFLLVVFIFYLSCSALFYFSFQQCLYSTCLTLSPLLLLPVVFIFYLSYSAPLYFSFQSCLYSTYLSLSPSTSPSCHVYILLVLLCPPLLLLLVVFIFYLSTSPYSHVYFLVVLLCSPLLLLIVVFIFYLSFSDTLQELKH